MKMSLSGQAEITNFLCQMDFRKKTIGGVDEEDVLDKFEHLTKLYESWIKSMQQEIDDAKKDNRFLKKQIEQYKTADSINGARINSLQTENKSVMRERDEWTSKARNIAGTLQQYEKEQVELITNAQREAQRIIMQAKARADELVAQKKREIEKQLSVQQAKVNQLMNQRKEMLDETDNLRVELRASMSLITNDLCQMLTQTKELDSKMAPVIDCYELKSI